MAQWFKIYEGTPSDTRLAMVASRLKIKRSFVIAAWLYVMDAASKAADRGSIAVDAEEMAFLLEEPEETVQAVLMAFRDRGLIQNGRVAEWNEGQRATTPGAERQRRYRERHQSSQVTDSDAAAQPGDGQVTPSDVEEKERERERTPPIVPPAGGTGEGIEKSFSGFWAERPGRGNAPDSEREAHREWHKLVEAGTPPETLQKALRGYAAWCREAGKDGTQYAKSAAAFLRENLWQQYAGLQSDPERQQEKLEPLPDWQQPLCSHMPEQDVRTWFRDAKRDGNRLVFPSRFTADSVKQRFASALKRVFGEVEISTEGAK